MRGHLKASAPARLSPPAHAAALELAPPEEAIGLY